jgi:hypothetical protein
MSTAANLEISKINGPAVVRNAGQVPSQPQWRVGISARKEIIPAKTVSGFWCVMLKKPSSFNIWHSFPF